MRSALIAVAAACLAGCSVGTTPGADAGGTDAASLDAGGGEDAGADAGAGSDAGMDAGPGPADAGLKSRCLGLMTRTGPPPGGRGGVFGFMDATVVEVQWAALEPAPGDFDGGGWQAIDSALDGGYAVRLRIRAGVGAPDWARALGGRRAYDLVDPDGGVVFGCDAGIAVFDPAGGPYRPGTPSAGCIPYFWESDVQASYQGLLQEVARRYENHPAVCEVVVAMCQTVFDEPFFRMHCEPRSIANMVDAGFAFAQDRACMLQDLAWHATYFPSTRASLAASGWDEVQANGQCTRDVLPDALGLADAGHALLGDRLVLQHNHLSWGDPCPGAPDSCAISQYAGPRGFQTQTLGKLTDGGTLAPDTALRATLDNGNALHAQFVELPSGFETALDAGELSIYDAALRGN